MTLYRGTILDTPAVDDGGRSGGPSSWTEPTRLRGESDGALVVRDGLIVARGGFAELRGSYDDDVVDLRGGLVLPGFVDTHVHFPQVRVIGGLGMPLLDWLERCALPEEARLSEAAYARGVAADFLAGLVAAGTTSALVFGSHFAGAMSEFFAAGAASGLRLTSGLVVSDRELRGDLLTTPERALAEGAALAARWHGAGRLRYAVTPRFAFSCSSALLGACGELAQDVAGAFVTSHVNENPAEIAGVGAAFPESADYVGVYEDHGLLGARTVLAHDVHPTPRELAVLASTRTAVAHCPTSNAALGSGLFRFARHAEAGVRVALGSDVGGGTGFCLLKEGLQAYFAQRLLPEAERRELTAADLLRLSTAAGADALGLGDVCGELSVGRAFDAVWLRPAAESTLGVGLRHADSAEDALAKAFALGTPADICGVWVGGDRLR